MIDLTGALRVDDKYAYVNWPLIYELYLKHGELLVDMLSGISLSKYESKSLVDHQVFCPAAIRSFKPLQSAYDIATNRHALLFCIDAEGQIHGAFPRTIITFINEQLPNPSFNPEEFLGIYITFVGKGIKIRL